MRPTARIVTMLVCAPLLATACGGGGGGGGPTGPDFAGTYHYVSIGGTDPAGPAEHSLAKFGTAMPGDGDLSLTYRRNASGDPFPPITESDLRYEVSSDGAFRWIIPFFSSAPYAEGGLGRGGELGLLATTFETGEPEVTLVLRRGGDPDETALVGSYWYLTWLHDADAGEHRSAYGGYLFDGAGSWDGTVNVNADGGTMVRTVTGWYTLNAGGDLVVNDGDFTLVGGLSADRTVAILGGASNPGAAGLAVLLRGHSVGGLDDTVLAGRYAVATLQHVGSGAYLTTVGTLDADGAGGWSMTVEGNRDGTWLPPATTSGTYEIGPTGRLNLRNAGGSLASGGVAADGSVACAARGSGPEDPAIWILVRR